MNNKEILNNAFDKAGVLPNDKAIKLNIPDVIGSYIIDGVEHNYTKEILRGDIAILTIDMIRILLDYMKNNGYDDVYITPLITELTNKGLEFAYNYR